jgi:hypothetical protein
MLPLTLADAGTPMILVGFAQLTIGNLFIGIIESLLVRKVFKVETAAAFLWIILANYLSCVAGIFFLGFVTNPIVHLIGGPVPIYALGRIAIVLAGLTFIITILVEWPFYWLGIRRKRPGAKTTFRANLVANAVTYSILAIFYWGIAQGPADWGFQLCPASLIAPNPQARILYLSPDGKEVIQLRIGNWTPTPVASLPPPTPNRALALMPSARSDRWQLVVADDPGAEHPGSPVVEIAGSRATTQPSYSDGTPLDQWDWFGGAFVADLQGLKSPRWTAYFEPGIYAELGVHDSTTGLWHYVHVLEMPILQWYPSHAALLPHDQLVFALGDQIMVADLDQNRIAAVAPGRSPVVVLDDSAPADLARTSP